VARVLVTERLAEVALDSLRDAGHEVGIHCYDHVLWQDFVARRDRAWTRRQMEKAAQAFQEALGEPAATLGAAGWQLNEHVPALEQDMGFTYASDVRGNAPFYPVMAGQASACMQLPTTLPTLDELIGRDGIDEHNAHGSVLAASSRTAPHGHVYTLHAELEGMKLLPVMRRLVEAWLADGYRFLTLGELHESLDAGTVPQKPVQWGTVEGRSGQLAVEAAI